MLLRILVACIYLTSIFLLTGCSDDSVVTDQLSVLPNSGVTGDTITLSGNFSGVAEVTMDGVLMTLVDQTSDAIRFVITPNVSAGINAVDVLIDGKEYPTVNFTLYPQILSTIKPVVTHNDEFVIDGTGFSPLATENFVTINQEQARVLVSSFTQMKVRITPNIPIGEVKLSLATSTWQSQNDLDVFVYGWKKVTNHPRGFFYSISSFSIADDIYFLLGQEFNDSEYVQEVWKYNLTQSFWTRMKDFPGAADKVIIKSVSVNGKGYCGLGTGRVVPKPRDFWEYDPATNDWTRKQDFPASFGGSDCTFALKGKIYVGTGVVGNQATDAFYSFDPLANKWSEELSFAGGGLFDASSFAVDDKVYVVGGIRGTGELVFKTWEFDGTTWLPKSDFPGMSPVELVSFGLDGFGYAGMGWFDPNLANQELWTYDSDEDRWESISPFPGLQRQHAICGTVGKFGYVAFGSLRFGRYSDIWLYLPKTAVE